MFLFQLSLVSIIQSLANLSTEFQNDYQDNKHGHVCVDLPFFKRTSCSPGSVEAGCVVSGKRMKLNRVEKTNGERITERRCL